MKKHITARIDEENEKMLSSIAKQEQRTTSAMLNKILTDTFDGTMMSKHSLLNFIKANRNVTAKSLIDYFKLDS